MRRGRGLLTDSPIGPTLLTEGIRRVSLAVSVAPRVHTSIIMLNCGRGSRSGPVPGTGLGGRWGDGMRLPLVMQLPQYSLAVGENVFLELLKPLLKGLSRGFPPSHSEWGAGMNNPYPRTTLRGKSDGARSRGVATYRDSIDSSQSRWFPPSGPG